MIQTLFLQGTDGRIGRLAFIGYAVLLAFVGAVFEIGLSILVFGIDAVVNSDADITQFRPESAAQKAVMALYAAYVLVFLYCNLNLTAKRFRDIGLPGWTAAFGFAVAGGVVFLLVSATAGLAFITLVALSLLVIPGNVFSKEPAD